MSDALISVCSTRPFCQSSAERCPGPQGAQAREDRARQTRKGFLEEGTLDFARQEGHSKKWSHRGRDSMSQARPSDRSQVPHSEGVRAGGGRGKRRREQIDVLREGGYVPPPHLTGANAPPPPPAALATPRPSARGPGNAQPTKPARGSASLASASLAPPREAPPPRGPAPALAWAGSRPRSGARASSSPPNPSPAARTPYPAPRGSWGQSRRGGSCPAAAAAAPPRLPGLGRRRRHKEKQHVRPQLLDGGGCARPPEPPCQGRAAAALQEVGGTVRAKARRPAKQTRVARSISRRRGVGHCVRR